MSKLHKFLFEGLPVRGVLVQLTDVWQEVLARRAANRETGAYAEPVRRLLGEMTAAAVLLQSNIKFDGALVLQLSGDGPMRLGVVEVQSDLRLRCTAKVVGEVSAQADLIALVHPQGGGQCAITLDPQNRLPGQQPYQGVVPLEDAQGQPLASLAGILERYMLLSEQLDTTLVLAANDERAAGLLIQRMPATGEANLSGESLQDDQDRMGHNEHYNRIATLASSLTSEELLSLDATTLLHRLFWQEQVRLYDPLVPRFACRCSEERVRQMIHALGREEAESVLQERPDLEVGCDYCGRQYRFDAVDVAQIFSPSQSVSGNATLQ